MFSGETAYFSFSTRIVKCVVSDSKIELLDAVNSFKYFTLGYRIELKYVRASFNTN